MASRRVSIAGACLLLIVVTAAVYGRVGSNPFVRFDDQQYVTENPHIQSGLNWESFVWAWTSVYASNWHPLTWISHELDWQLYGISARGHHITSLVIHILNVLLLFLLLVSATGKTGRSLLVAALFALHPFNVESVAWVAERKNVLCTLFFLLAIAAYGWYALKPGVKRYLLVAALFALALAAKPMVITLPFVLLLLDFWPLERIEDWGQVPVAARRKGRKPPVEVLRQASHLGARQAKFSRLVLEKLPFLALCAGSAVLTIVAQRAAGSIETFTQQPFATRVENAIYAYARYLWKAAWPLHLAVFYPHHDPSLLRMGLALLLLFGISAIVWQQRWKRRYLLVGWLWYLGTLVPVIGILQVGDQAMADRFAYIPLIGIFVMGGWAAADWVDGKRIGMPWRTGAAFLVLAGLSFLTWRQIGYWRSTYELWAHTLNVTRDNLLAEVNTGEALRELRRPEEAVPHLQRAVELNPPDPMLHVELAAGLAQCGRLPEAAVQYEKAAELSQDPRVVGPACESLAALYAKLGDYVKVQQSYRRALQVNPRIAPSMIQHLSQRVSRNPTGGGYLSLGLLLQATGKASEAQAAYEQALKLDPGLKETETSLFVLREEKP